MTTLYPATAYPSPTTLPGTTAPPPDIDANVQTGLGDRRWASVLAAQA